ncbi:MAG: tolA, partial [Solirubrobacteraceae bacterium]|nr:tolA [Solirubrobacteraceae bacterium]
MLKTGPFPADTRGVGTRRFRWTLAALFAVAIAAVQIAAPARTAAAGTPFAPDSVWNAPLAADAPLDGHSARLVAELRRQLVASAPWINTTSYSAPVYTVPATQPTVRIQVWGTSALFTSWADQATLDGQFAAVPLPADARPAPGGDGHVVVWQPSTNSLWEIWQLESRADGWHASWGGKISDVSDSPGYFTPSGFGATATGLSLLGGMIRTSELRAGHIDHALGFAIPHPRSGSVWSWPAQRSDGDNPDPDAIPEGARFRLDPRLDIAALDLPPVTRMIAEAVQRYGMVLRDKGGCVCFYAEDPAGAANPYPQLFSGLGPDQLLARFPWASLAAMKMSLNDGSDQAADPAASTPTTTTLSAPTPPPAPPVSIPAPAPAPSATAPSPSASAAGSPAA